jgi:methionine-R-sulfoxide reductase
MPQYSALMAKKTDEEYKEMLTDEQFWVTRQAGTERAFSGMYNSHKEAGNYNCVCCHALLFSSDDKFDSGCGWPSFSKHMENDKITFHEDASHGTVRTEVRCAECEAHLGHVFDDGPAETGGQRYCINSASLGFEDKK